MKARIGELLTRKLLPNPTFVVGIGRSGTSVLLDALGLHPLILPARGEAPLIRMFGRFVDSVEYSDERDYYEATLVYPKEYLYHYLRRLCFEYVAGQNYGLDNPIAEDSWQYRKSMLRKRRWCAKTFPTADEYRGIVKLYPEARFVYIVRNGINVVHSRTKFPGFRHLDFAAHCETWAESIEVFGFLWTASNAISVRQEELIHDPEGLFRKVFDFTNLDYDEKPAEFVKNNLVIPLDQPSQSDIDVKQAFEARRLPFESWTREQRRTFKEIAGTAMREAGYELPF